LQCKKTLVAMQHGGHTLHPIHWEEQLVTMTEAWNTQYGPRRVRRDPPTLEEAVFAAEGLTDDPQAQAEIAASLMDVPVDQVKEAIKKARRSTLRAVHVRSIERGGTQRAVVVERRVSRRPLAAVSGVSRVEFRGAMR
jgi:hypothetical protein